MSQYDPFWRALADLQALAARMGCNPAVIVFNIPEPPLPDWDAERRATGSKYGQG